MYITPHHSVIALSYLAPLSVVEGLLKATVHRDWNEEELFGVSEVLEGDHGELAHLTHARDLRVPHVLGQAVHEETYDEHRQAPGPDVDAHHGPHLAGDRVRGGGGRTDVSKCYSFFLHVLLNCV